MPSREALGDAMRVNAKDEMLGRGIEVKWKSKDRVAGEGIKEGEHFGRSSQSLCSGA